MALLISLVLTGEQTSHRHDTEERSGDERGEHYKGAGGYHVLESGARGDGDASLVVRAFGGALVQQTRVLRQRKYHNKGGRSLQYTMRTSNTGMINVNRSYQQHFYTEFSSLGGGITGGGAGGGAYFFSMPSTTSSLLLYGSSTEANTRGVSLLLSEYAVSASPPALCVGSPRRTESPPLAPFPWQRYPLPSWSSLRTCHNPNATSKNKNKKTQTIDDCKGTLHVTSVTILLRETARQKKGTGWDGMGWDGMGWDGMGWDGMGCDVTVWDETGRDGMGWDAMRWDGMG